MKSVLKISTWILAGLFVFATSAYALEGKIEITTATTITLPGSYIVVNNIESAYSAIQIYSSNVKLDLNGFTLSQSSANNADGIVVGGSSYKNIEITNGNVRGFGRHGIFVPGSSVSPTNIKLSNLHVTDNRITGISLESNPGFIIDGCFISGNALGIYANSPGLVLNNVIGENGTGMVSYSAGKVGYLANVFYNKGGADVSGTAKNLGQNLCSGVLCP